MNIHNVSLTISAVRPNQYPTTGYMEFAFAGRSNVGKSSMINKLLNRKSLARVSGTPGKTITINFYNIHYNATHFVGTSGSNTQDMKDAIALIENKTVNVAKIATHIMGLNHVCESILNLPKMPGGKKIVYSGKEFPVTDVSAFGENNELEKHLKELVDAHDGLWNAEAEQYFLEHAKDI